MRLLSPLRHRDFRLLWGGMCISLMGDGVFMVAMAWQVYALSNAPTAVSDAIGVRATLVGAAVVGGIITFGALLLPGMRAKEGAPPREHELVATMPLPA